MADDSPLHLPPSRPIVDDAGRVTNPLSGEPAIELDDGTPIPPDALLPDATYSSEGFEYLTDEYRLPARVRSELRLVPTAERVRHLAAQRATGRLPGDGSPGYQGGHIAAVSLGGFASGPNLFPQVHNFNVSAYARLEHGWRRALRDGVGVAVDIALTLDPDPHVPAFVIVTYWEDDHEFEHVMLNEANAQ